MKVFSYGVGFAALLGLTGCAGFSQQQQQPWGGQQPYGYGNQQPYGYGGQQQQPYGYGGQQPSGNQGGSTMGGVVGMVLMNILMGQLGINQQQALGGAGSLFLVAQQRMQPAEFSRLSAAVPEMDRYLAAAPRLNNNNGYQQQGAIGGLMSVAGSFQQLGMGPDMMARFIPVLLQHVQQQGGQATMLPLQNALR
jgi:hypothetical protein